MRYITVAEMRVDAAVAVGAGVGAPPQRHVLPRLRVAVALRQAEVNQEDDLLLLAPAHRKVARLDVAVDEALAVEGFNARDLWREG